MDQFFEKVFNPYLAEVKKHCQILQLKDGVVHKQDLEEPSKEGDEKTRLEEVEQDNFKCKGMVEREVDVNHRILSELLEAHKKETR